MKRQMKLGLSMRGIGYHAAAWRHPSVPPNAALDFRHYLHNAQMAERGKFDMIFFADGIGIRSRDVPEGSLSRSGYEVAELEPITLLSAIAPMTQHIGLITTASTTYNEPFHIARKFASLDLISGGRAGWNVVTSWSDAEARNFNRDAHLDYETRYDRAKEALEVVLGLWDSWDDDAFVFDKAAGQYYDPAKLHALNHKGKHFSVRGPLNVGRSPQGHPVIVQAGASEQGREMAGASAEIVYTLQYSLEGAKAYYDSVKSHMPKYGRSPDDLKIMPGFIPVVGRTRAEAQAKFDELQALVEPIVGLQRIAPDLGDLSGYPLDELIPEVPVGDAEMRSSQVQLRERLRREQMTIRQLYLAVCGGRAFKAIGTAGDVADAMEQWLDAGAADGFNITPTMLPQGIDDFVELVVPELQRRGVFRTEYTGTTLRENLGLKKPVSRYQRPSQSAAAE
jgi:FMN-dependent oxidoreductase (nitrilotriacetate monooxygenase family)